MASYPKIWTTIESASWWQALDLNARGVVTQMIIWCKKDGDTGHLEFRSWRFLAERLGCHRDTCTKIASNLATLGFIEITERPNGTLHLYLPMYLESQQATSHFDVMKMVGETADLDQNCSKNSQQPNQTEPNRTEQNQTEASSCSLPTPLPVLNEGKVRKVYELLYNSDWRHLVSDNTAFNWVRSLIRSVGEEKAEDGVNSIIEFYKTRGLFIPNKLNGRVKVFDWCKRPKMESQDDARRKAIETWEPTE